MEIFRLKLLHDAWLIFQKDIRQEFKTRYSLGSGWGSTYNMFRVFSENIRLILAFQAYQSPSEQIFTYMSNGSYAAAFSSVSADCIFCS